MIAIIKGIGNNIASVQYALERLGIASQLTDDAELIRTASHVILPGVGHAAAAMQKLRRSGLDQVITQLTQPCLGICLGMQLLYQFSAEGDTDCLGIIPATIQRFNPHTSPRIPHMGWNHLQAIPPDHALLNNLQLSDQVYFVHSFIAPVNHNTLAMTEYGEPFSAIINYRNFYGMQFHPERSGAVGEQLLKNFLELA